jgi:predicted GNAT family N-acyltransferase
MPRGLRSVVTACDSSNGGLVVDYSIAATPDERAEARELIHQAFVEELCYEGEGADIFDDHAVFLIGRNSAGVVAAFRVILDGEAGLPLDYHIDLEPLRAESTALAEVSRLACLPEHHSNLVGLRGVGFLKSVAQQVGATHFVIDSLVSLAPLYRRIGFLPVGEPFVDHTVCAPGETVSEPNAQVMWADVDVLRGW